jgi:hypothetical protein
MQDGPVIAKAHAAPWVKMNLIKRASMSSENVVAHHQEKHRQHQPGNGSQDDQANAEARPKAQDMLQFVRRFWRSHRRARCVLRSHDPNLPDGPGQGSKLFWDGRRIKFLAWPRGVSVIFAMNLMKDRSRAEMILFAVIIFGIWLSIWAVIFVSAWLEAIAVLTVLIPLLVFAFRAGETE